MSLLSTNIDGWLIHTVTYKPIASVSAYGDPTYGTAVSVAARVEKKERIQVASDGTQRKVQWTIVSKVAIPLAARVWLPGDNTSTDSQARRPLDVVSAPTKDGTFTLYETYFG